METVHSPYESADKKKSSTYSAVIHIIILAILIFPFLKYPDPPPGQEGILVSFGEPEVGQGDSRPDTQDEIPIEDPTPPTEDEAEPDVTEEEEKEPTKPTKSETKPEKQVKTQDDAAAIALKKKREKEQREAQEKADKEAADKKAKEDARKAKEAADKKAKEEAKKQFGDLFGGDGKGETDTPGNQGSPTGDPDAENLEGISTGSGTVGGGLGARGVTGSPTVTNTTNKSGKIRVKLCVNANGNVIASSVKFTQSGSNSTDSGLKKIAISAAKKYQFKKGTMAKQCGHITFNFKFEN